VENRLVDAGCLNFATLTYRTLSNWVALRRLRRWRVRLAVERRGRGWLAELHHAHALVLNPETNEIRMANPFSAVPTAYRVQAADGGGTATARGMARDLRRFARMAASRHPARIVVRHRVRRTRPAAR